MKKPRSPNRPPPASAVAPSSRPDSRKPLTRSNCSSETSGPICVPASSPDPSLIDLAISATPSTTSSNRLWCTNSREPATQHCPWLKKIAFAAPSTAPSTASSKTMFGLLPPSSSVTFFRLLAPAAATIILPTSVDPVNATLSTSLCAASAAPAVSPKPGTTFTTPSGTPGLGDQLAQPHRGQRGLLGRLEHHAVPRRQRRAELPGRHQQREVPRDDLADHADRLAQRVGVPVRARHVRHRDADRVALDLGGPARHVMEQVRGQRHVGGLRHRERLAVIQRLQLGKLVDVLPGSGHRSAR